MEECWDKEDEDRRGQLVHAAAQQRQEDVAAREAMNGNIPAAPKLRHGLRVPARQNTDTIKLTANASIDMLSVTRTAPILSGTTIPARNKNHLFMDEGQMTLLGGYLWSRETFLKRVSCFSCAHHGIQQKKDAAETVCFSRMMDRRLHQLNSSATETGKKD